MKKPQNISDVLENLENNFLEYDGNWIRKNSDKMCENVLMVDIKDFIKSQFTELIGNIELEEAELPNPLNTFEKEETDVLSEKTLRNAKRYLENNEASQHICGYNERVQEDREVISNILK
jgi:hypothetical protein